MAQQLPNNLANALRYGPQTGQSIRRSQYLTDALQAMQAEGGKDIRSGGELAAKLLATAILSRGSKKADRAALEAITGERTAAVDRARVGLGAMGPQTLAPAGTGSVANPGEIGGMVQPPAMSALPMSMSALPTAGPQVQPPPQQGGADPVWQAAIQQESGGRPGVLGPMTRYGQAQGLTQMLPETAQAMAQKLGVPWRPEMMTANTPEGAAYQEQLGRAYFDEGLQKYGGDPQKALMYYHGGPNEQLWGPKTRAHAEAVMGRVPQGQQAPPQGPGQDQMQPFQVAANGPLTPQMMPQQGMAPPMPQGPQAAPQQAPQGPPGATYWKPSQREIAYFEELVSNPRTVEAGLAYGQQLREKMAEPIKYDTATVGGLPTQIDPYTGQLRVLPVPQEAMFQTMTAQQGGLPTAPQGAYVQRDPLGKLSAAPFAPPEGFNAIPGQGYAPIRGGPQDPTRQQAPATGYQYAAPGVQTPIQGGPNDIKALPQVMEGANRMGGMIKTVVDSAMKVKQNYGAVIAGYRQQNGTGDIAMTNGLQKLIDDGVVKGEDVNMQMKSNGLDGTVGGWQQYATSGGLFTPDVRNKLYKTATDLYRNLDQTYRSRVESMRPGFDEAYGAGTFGKYVFPDAFAQELGWGDAAIAPPAPAPQPPRAPTGPVPGASGGRAAAMEEARRRGLIR